METYSGAVQRRGGYRGEGEAMVPIHVLSEESGLGTANKAHAGLPSAAHRVSKDDEAMVLT